MAPYHHDAKSEHSHALLADDELSDDSSILKDSPSQRPVHKRRWVWLGCVVLVSVLILVGAVWHTKSIILRPDNNKLRPDVTMFKPDNMTDNKTSLVFQDDYILDQSWDYLAPVQRREYEWVLEETEFNPDGVFRPLLLINNQFPGPLIEANEEDTIRVTIHNHLSNSTSLHWHGIFQNGTNFMDGTVGVTQCPIAPGATFTYEFTVTGQSGTYWYHAHQGAQTSDGLYGPLIIHSRSEGDRRNPEYSSDRIVMLSDHYHHLSSALARQYLAPDMENTEPVPDGALINGRAIRDCDALPNKRCDNSTVIVPRFQVEAQQGQRLRIINTGAFAEFQFQIDEHELAIVEVDGTDVQPAYYHRLNISPAQRYSVIIQANQTHRDTFRVRARMVDNCFAGNNPSMIKDVEAIIDYGTYSTSTPASIDWAERLDIECRDMNVTELVPLSQISAPAHEDAFFYIRSNFRIGSYRLSRGFFNESSWKTNATSPTLSRFLSSTSSSSTLLTTTTTNNEPTSLDTTLFSPTSELTISSTGIQTIDILIHNTDDGSHPMHLHGYKYFVLASGRGYPPRTSLLEGVSRSTVSPIYDNLNLSNPLRRDTASVEADGWMLLRFVADNPGIWAFHCHIAWHSEAGLMMQFVTRADELIGTEMPDANKELCAAAEEDLVKGMSPSDESYYDEASNEESDRNGSGCEGESVNNCSYGD